MGKLKKFFKKVGDVIVKDSIFDKKGELQGDTIGERLKSSVKKRFEPVAKVFSGAAKGLIEGGPTGVISGIVSSTAGLVYDVGLPDIKTPPISPGQPKETATTEQQQSKKPMVVVFIILAVIVFWFFKKKK